jgi:hypothetical protein
VAINYAVPWIVPEVSKAAESVSAGNTTALKVTKWASSYVGKDRRHPEGRTHRAQWIGGTKEAAKP